MTLCIKTKPKENQRAQGIPPSYYLNHFQTGRADPAKAPRSDYSYSGSHFRVVEKTYPAQTNAIGVTSRQNWGELSFSHLESVPAQRSIRNNPKKRKVT